MSAQSRDENRVLIAWVLTLPLVILIVRLLFL